MRPRDAASAVLGLAIAAAAPGCFDSHELGAAADGGRFDGRPAADARIPTDAPFPDAPRRPDAGDPDRLCRRTGFADMAGTVPGIGPATRLNEATVTIEGADRCPTTLTFILMDSERPIDPLALPEPRVELEATIDTDLLDEPFSGDVDGLARAIDEDGRTVDEVPADLDIEAARLEFGPGGRVEGAATVRFVISPWMTVGDSDAPYCFASICL